MVSKKETITLPIINFSRKHFRNTWIHRIPLTSWIYLKLFKFTFSNEPEKEIIFRGSKYKVLTKDSAVVPSMMSGDYEKFELELFSKILNKKDTVLDIGGNIGVYAIEASKVVGRNGKIYSFEPISENIELLEHNITINDLKNITVVKLGIGKKKSRLKIYKAKNSIATHSAGIKSKKFEEVEITTIDNFVEDNNLKVNLIKMDIEGYEGFAVEGGIKTFRQQQPVLFIEFSSDHLKRCGYSPEKHAKNLLKLYKYCYFVDEKKNTLRRISDYTEIIKLRNDNLVLSPIKISI